MSDDAASNALRGYLAKLSPEQNIEAIADDTEAPMRMSAAPGVVKSEATKAHNAAKKLAAGKDITEGEQFLVEAIILPDLRPAVDVVDGDYFVEHHLWTHLNQGPKRANLLRAIPSIGRVEIPDHATAPYGGTGFLVGGGLIMTNRHVAELFARGLGSRGLTFLPGQTSEIDFKREIDRDEKILVEVTDIEMIHPYWDMALLRVVGVPAEIRPLTLSMREPEELVGNEIAVIGYPAFDPRNPAAVQNKVFKGKYYVKRMQPGLIAAREKIRSYGKAVNAATHDASTLGGNSGSCVVDLTSGEVVALHFAGRYQQANYAVPSYELSRDDEVVYKGVEFGEDGSSNVEDPNPWRAWWTQADRDSEGMEPQAGEPDAAAMPDPAPAAQAPSVAAPSGSMTWTIPLQVTVNFGAPQMNGAPGVVSASAAPAVASDAATEKMVAPKHDEDYAGRPGYDPDFLGIPVPMPEATNTDDLSALSCGEHRLDYYHFSLVMNARRRIAQVTAANVDASPGAVEPEPGRDYSRRGLNGFTSRNDRERWFLDPRIPADHQLPDKFFTKDRKAFDKGHVVRRNAVVWGRTYQEIQNANGDTFHVTNCSPQVKGFNRSNLGGTWGKLENTVLDGAETEKLCVLAGPVLKPDDPIFHGVDDDGDIQVRIPRAYWKVICAVSRGKLQTFAFRLEQDLSDVAFEFSVGAEWKHSQIALRALEDDLESVAFGGALLDADMI